jgi:hypothetical protein
MVLVVPRADEVAAPVPNVRDEWRRANDFRHVNKVRARRPLQRDGVRLTWA